MQKQVNHATFLAAWLFSYVDVPDEAGAGSHSEGYVKRKVLLPTDAVRMITADPTLPPKMREAIGDDFDESVPWTEIEAYNDSIYVPMDFQSVANAFGLH